MKRLFAVFVPVAILATHGVLAMDKSQYMKYEADCGKYALEDSVPAEDMDAYMEQCMKDLAGASDELSETPPETEENKE